MSDDEAPLYKDRPEWADIAPVPQDDAAQPVCPIVYDARFVDTMDYFRAVVRADERSARALELTADVIDLNPANYTAWQFRRLCLYALGESLAAELDGFVYGLSRNNPKNYQMWHHRRACAERLGAAASDDAERAAVAERELKFCHKQVLLDSKNLHAWAHRQWAVQHFATWDDELDFVESLLTDDVRNNSAWNHRFFVPEPPTRQSEVEYAMAAIRKAPNNESPWSYLRGVLLSRKAAALGGDSSSIVALVDQVEKQCQELQQSAPACAHCVALQLDFAEWRAESAEADVRAEHLSGAQALCDLLVTQRDPLHANYWTYRKSKIAEQLTA